MKNINALLGSVLLLVAGTAGARPLPKEIKVKISLNPKEIKGSNVNSMNCGGGGGCLSVKSTNSK